MTSAVNNNNKFTFKEPRRQCFAFPSDVISHLLMNPKSGNGLEKLYQTCKYFFSKRKILVIKQYGHLMDTILKSTFRNNKKILYCNADIRKIEALIWPTGDLQISNSLSINFKTIYRCSVRRLVLHDITLSYNEFEFLVAENTVKDFDFRGASIYLIGKSHVSLDVILKNLPNVETFRYKNRNETFSKKTLRKITEVPLNMNLKNCFFYIFNISNDFNPELLCQFFEQHPICSFKVYIVNARSSEIKQNIEAALTNIIVLKQLKKFHVTVYGYNYYY